MSFRKFVHFICVEILWNIFLLSLSCPEVYRDISTFIPQIGNLCFLFLSWWVWLYVYQFHWSLQKPVFGYIILFLFTAHYRFHLFLLLSLFFLYFDYLGLICLFFLLSQGGSSDIDLRTFLPVLTEHLHVDVNLLQIIWEDRAGRHE